MDMSLEARGLKKKESLVLCWLLLLHLLLKSSVGVLIYRQNIGSDLIER